MKLVQTTQNHRCKWGGRQFVLNNSHTKLELLMALIKKALKERLSLRVMCRIFDVSLTWLQKITRALWEKAPRSLGSSNSMVDRTKKLQGFGFQIDELLSFVQKKKKRWTWVAYDPVHRFALLEVEAKSD